MPVFTMPSSNIHGREDEAYLLAAMPFRPNSKSAVKYFINALIFICDPEVKVYFVDIVSQK